MLFDFSRWLNWHFFALSFFFHIQFWLEIVICFYQQTIQFYRCESLLRRYFQTPSILEFMTLFFVFINSIFGCEVFVVKSILWNIHKTTVNFCCNLILWIGWHHVQFLCTLSDISRTVNTRLKTHPRTIILS